MTLSTVAQTLPDLELLERVREAFADPLVQALCDRFEDCAVFDSDVIADLKEQVEDNKRTLRDLEEQLADAQLDRDTQSTLANRYLDELTDWQLGHNDHLILNRNTQKA